MKKSLGGGVNLPHPDWNRVELVKLLKVPLLGPYLGKNWSSMRHTQNQAQFFCVETTKGDHKL